MIDPRTVRKLITHDNCADGLTSALVAREVCGSHLPIEFVAYNTAQHRELEPELGVVFADFCLHADSVEAWLPFDPWVLDHHHHAQGTVRRFPRGVFDNEQCGARLLLSCLDGEHPPELVELANLADVRDRWVKSSPLWDKAQAQARVLMALHRDVAFSLGVSGLLRYADFGVHLAATERRRATDVVAREQGFDMTACFFLTEDQATRRRSVVYSLRSGERVDCGAFAKHLGGGGHQRAAGFDVELRIASDPWTHVLVEFGLWLQSRGGAA